MDGAEQTLCARSVSVGNTMTGFLCLCPQFTAELTALMFIKFFFLLRWMEPSICRLSYLTAYLLYDNFFYLSNYYLSFLINSQIFSAISSCPLSFGCKPSTKYSLSPSGGSANISLYKSIYLNPYNSA